MAILLPLDDQFFNDDGTPAAGKQMFCYVAGSSTKTTTWTDATGGTANANPVVLNSDGRPPGGNGIWGITGVTYDLHLASATDTDPPTGATIDYDGRVGVETPTSTQSEWVASGQDATYISATSFSVVGDQTATYEVNRRLQVVDGGGTKYVTIKSATFGSVTTVVVTGDSLAAAITAVSLGLITATDDSLPRIVPIDKKATAVASATTPDIWVGEGSTLHITGTTTITGFAAAPNAGAWRKLLFDGAVLLTDGANLVVPGGNYTTAADDMVWVYADTTTKFYLFIFPADGSAAADLYVTLTGNQSVAGIKTFSDTTDATSSTAGGTIISGGLAIAKKLFVGTLLDLSTAAAGQIKFPATQNASADLNTLDDYEENVSLTPVVSAASGTITAYTSSGAYVKIGRKVHFSFNVTITTNGTGAGYLKIDLPFTAGAEFSGVAKENLLVGKAVTCYNTTGTSFLRMTNTSDDAYPAADGYRFVGSIEYMV